MRRLAVVCGGLALALVCVVLVSDMWMEEEVGRQASEEEVEAYCKATGRCILRTSKDTQARDALETTERTAGEGGGEGGRREEKQRVIFVASHGHSGTLYLKDVLAHFSNVSAYHEQEPRTLGMAEVRRQGMEATYGLRMAKARAVQQLVAALPPMHVYCDTSHQFLLTWPDVLTDLLAADYDVTVLVLRRELALTVRSHLASPEYNPRELPAYALLPSLPLDLLASVGIDAALDAAIGYAVDVELRLAAYRRQYPEVRVVETRLEELETEEGAQYLGQQLGLAWNASAESRIGHRENRHVGFRQRLDEPVEHFRQAVETWLQLYSAAGIDLPPVPGRSCVTQCAAEVVEGEKKSAHGRMGGKGKGRGVSKLGRQGAAKEKEGEEEEEGKDEAGR